MERTTIMAPEELLNRLRRIAQSRGVSLASLIREALEEKAAKERRRPAIAGMAASGLSNLVSGRVMNRSSPRLGADRRHWSTALLH